MCRVCPEPLHSPLKDGKKTPRPKGPTSTVRLPRSRPRATTPSRPKSTPPSAPSWASVLGEVTRDVPHEPRGDGGPPTNRRTPLGHPTSPYPHLPGRLFLERGVFQKKLERTRDVRVNLYPSSYLCPRPGFRGNPGSRHTSGLVTDPPQKPLY